MKKIIIFSLIVSILVGCAAMKNIQYVPVETTKTEYVSKVDTTIIKDSVFIDRWRKADTVYLTKFKYKYIEKIKRDTLHRVDTIHIVQKVNVDVPYVPEYYKKINGLFWGLVVAVVIFILLKIYFKFKR